MSKKWDKSEKFGEDNPAFTTDFLDSLDTEPKQFLPRIITKDPKHDHNSVDSPYTTGGAVNPPTTNNNNNNNDDPEGSKTQLAEEEGDERDTWDSPIEFLLSCISMSVGLGNVWRFPGVAARNGGGAFLIPYLVVLLLIGRPLYYLELCLGQFSRYGQVKVWNMAPLFKGVGYGSIIGVISLTSYYCALMAITVYFFIASFAKDLPWTKCNDDQIPAPETCLNYTGNEAYAYYHFTVLPQLENVDHGLGKLNWQLTLCLIFSWVLIFLSLIKGVKSSGKVAYFTAIFPYVVLLILLVRGVTLPGAWTGIKKFITPEWKEILKPKVWYAAVEQSFFSLAAGFGPIVMFSSFNNFRQNIYRDALIISFMDTFTSFLAGITVFSVMGNLMEEDESTEIIVTGPALAFILYPQALAKLDWVPQLFAVLFFFMLFTLGIGTASPLTGGVITIICDQFTNFKRWIVTLVVCIIGCLSGLLYVNEGGMFMLDLIDHYGSGFIIYVMVIVECSAISYVYGVSNICDDFEFMLGRTVGIYWKICWAIVIPVGLLANLIYYLATEPEYMYNNETPYPPVATIFGWLLTAFAASMVPVWAIHAVATRKAPTLKEKFLEALRPTRKWGPQKMALRQEWLAFRAKKAATSKRFWIF